MIKFAIYNKVRFHVAKLIVWRPLVLSLEDIFVCVFENRLLIKTNVSIEAGVQVSWNIFTINFVVYKVHGAQVLLVLRVCSGKGFDFILFIDARNLYQVRWHFCNSNTSWIVIDLINHILTDDLILSIQSILLSDCLLYGLVRLVFRLISGMFLEIKCRDWFIIW